MKVLVADDDPISRLLLERTLVKLGHDVVAVADGQQAQALLAASDGPQLAVLDWMMPGLDGIEVCRIVRKQAGPYVYVILLTARDRREDLLVALEAEVDEFLTKPVDPVELRARLRSGQRVLNLQEALRREAMYDRLTAIKNRGAILDQLETERRRMARTNRPLSVLLLDIDHFKRVNDTFGHLAGDVVLRESATRFRDTLRDYDGLGRYGGEEFLVVLPECDREHALEVAGRLRSHVSAEPVFLGGPKTTVTISIGVVSTTQAGLYDSTALINAADLALYQAKTNGRNRAEEAVLDAPSAQAIHGSLAS